MTFRMCSYDKDNEKRFVLHFNYFQKMQHNYSF